MKILLIGTNKKIRDAIKKNFNKESFIIEECKDELEALEKIKKEEIKIVLIKQKSLPCNNLKLLKIFRKVRRSSYLYIIIFALNNKKENLYEILKNGADDYILKPWDIEKLHSKIEQGKKAISFYEDIRDKLKSEISPDYEDISLKKLVPMCSYCKSVRLGKNLWQRVEEFVFFISGIILSHGICPKCFNKYIKPKIERAKINKIC